ncbi:serine hydrolase [Nocardia spumae]|uniref:serine hydrolase n=1 Tax=Nocardia spumae TaxID=2887190 RepID=UPI001D1582C7|nr:serine hydrolase [Nocardia spumae]
MDTATGTTLAGLNTDQRFYTASVVKLLIALDELKSVNWQPDSDSAALLSRMLATSDDDIADTLWDGDGGPDIVSRMAGAIGLSDTTPPDDPTQWGETRTTPADVVRIYRSLTTGIPPSARDTVLTALDDAAATAADGTDQYYGIPDALPGTEWAVERGWMTLDDSTTLNTTGLVSTDSARPALAAPPAVGTATAETVTCSSACPSNDR